MIGAKYHIIQKNGRVKTVERRIGEKEFLAAKEIVEAYRKQQMDRMKREMKMRNKYSKNKVQWV